VTRIKRIVCVAEIHRYFEQQMDEMIRSFGLLGSGEFPGWGGEERSGEPHMWGGKLHQDQEEAPDWHTGRDFMLKHHGKFLVSRYVPVQ
jgi:hypothetical protein